MVPSRCPGSLEDRASPRQMRSFAAECSRVSQVACCSLVPVEGVSMSAFSLSPLSHRSAGLQTHGNVLRPHCSAYRMVLLGVCLLLGCRDASQAPTGGVLRLATTTSAKDSGLLDELLPLFEAQQNCRVDVLAVGTGAALRLGELGEVDALVVHAPQAELALMEAGHGSRREAVMVNYFVVLGPEADPAGIRGCEPALALRKIQEQGLTFVSRGDRSGTHQRESALWEAAGGLKKWSGYQETGEGMGHTLTVADQLQGYVLADQGTYLKFRDKISLVSLLPESKDLVNPYSVIAVQPAKHDGINEVLATALIEFLISAETQRMINDYRVSGQPLFRAAHSSGK